MEKDNRANRYSPDTRARAVRMVFDNQGSYDSQSAAIKAIAKGITVTRLSAGMTLIGFPTAFPLTLLGGWLADSTDWIEMALTPSLIFMIVALGALGRAARYPNYE